MSSKTGRTQIRIVQAVCAMLMGKTVLHVSGTSGASKSALAYAKDWLHDNGWVSQSYAPLTVDNCTQVIRFGTGELRFTCMEKRRGLRYSTVMNDHFVEECIEATAKKAEQEADKNTIAKLLRKHQWTTVQSYGIQFHGGDTNKTTVRLNLLERTPE